MFNNKTTKEVVIQDGTKIKMSLTVQSTKEYDNFEELKTLLGAIKGLYQEITDETLSSNAAEAVKDMFGIKQDNEI